MSESEVAVDRGTWVVTVRAQTYVWPRGEVVQVYGLIEYVRRLSGELRDAEPHRSVHVRGFDRFEDFREWCRRERRAF